MIFEKPQSIDKNYALGQIHILERQIMDLGANDYEPSAIQSIKEAVTNDKMTPEDGIRKMQEILDSKMDYH